MSKSKRVGICRIRPYMRSGQPTTRWQVDIPSWLAGGKRQRRLFDSVKQAETFAKELERRYRNGSFNVSQSIVADVCTFRDAVERWLDREEDRVRTKKKRPVSLRTDRYRLIALLEFFGDAGLEAITEEAITRFQIHRLDEGKSPSTVQSDERTLRKVLRWAHKTGLLKVMPEWELVSEQARDDYVPSPEEVVKIIDVLPDRLKTLVRLLFETGCRQGEAFHLTWDCVDLEGCWIAIRKKDGWTPKTRHSERTIPISVGLSAELSMLPRSSRYVFPGRVPGKPLTNMKRAFEGAIRRSGISQGNGRVPTTPHTLRKAYATWTALRGDVPASVLKKYLGHSPASQVTDRYYIRPPQETLSRAVMELPLGEQTGNPDRPVLATDWQQGRLARSRQS